MREQPFPRTVALETHRPVGQQTKTDVRERLGDSFRLGVRAGKDLLDVFTDTVAPRTRRLPTRPPTAGVVAPPCGMPESAPAHDARS